MNYIQSSFRVLWVGGASKIVVDIIKGFDLDGILKKTFYDL